MMYKKGVSPLILVIGALSVVIIAFSSIVPIQPAVISVIQIEEETLIITECYQTKVTILSTLYLMNILPWEENPGDYTLEAQLFSQGDLITSERSVDIGAGEYKVSLVFWGNYENLIVRFVLLDSEGNILVDRLYELP